MRYYQPITITRTRAFLSSFAHVGERVQIHHNAIPTAADTRLKNRATATGDRRCASFVFVHPRRVRSFIPPPSVADNVHACRALRPRSNCRRGRVGSPATTACFRRERPAVTRYYMHLRESHREASRRRLSLSLSLSQPVHHSLWYHTFSRCTTSLMPLYTYRFPALLSPSSNRMSRRQRPCCLFAVNFNKRRF